MLTYTHSQTSMTRCLDASPSGGLVGMVDGHKIWVWKAPTRAVNSAKAVAVMLVHHVRDLTALAFDPTETVLAAGDETGRILLWQNIGERSFGADSEVGTKGTKRKRDDNLGQMEVSSKHDDVAALTTYHWHSHEVKCLTFSPDGVYLISGIVCTL